MGMTKKLLLHLLLDALWKPCVVLCCAPFFWYCYLWNASRCFSRTMAEVRVIHEAAAMTHWITSACQITLRLDAEGKHHRSVVLQEDSHVELTRRRWRICYSIKLVNLIPETYYQLNSNPSISEFMFSPQSFPSTTNVNAVVCRGSRLRLFVTFLLAIMLATITIIIVSFYGHDTWALTTSLHRLT